MTAYPTPLNAGQQEAGNIQTAAERGDPTAANTPASDHWFMQMHAGDGALETVGTKADISVHTGTASLISVLKSLRDYFRARIPGDATWVNASSGNVAAASAVATIGATSAKLNYVTGFEITFAGATAAANVVATLAGLAGGTISFIVSAPAGATVQGVPLIVKFDPPLPASAVNTAITLTLPSLGTGNTHACVNIHGWKI